jgi:SAM-dependent methyltransferase
MEVTQQISQEQSQLWNGPAGHAWVAAQHTLDRLFAPFEHLLIGEVLAGAARRVLDVGCGTGATTLAVARRLGDGGSHVIGVDISAVMLDLARERASRDRIRAAFVEADAQSHEFVDSDFDIVISRFGVMFFSEPTLAFANLRRATRAGGRLAAIAFRHADENPFMTTAERAAAPLLPTLPARRPGPGQFAFADASRVRGILEAAGWVDVQLQPLDVVCTMPEGELRPYVTRLGPVGLALAETDEATRSRVVAAVRGAFSPYVHGNEIRFTAACWLLKATSPAV